MTVSVFSSDLIVYEVHLITCSTSLQRVLLTEVSHIYPYVRKEGTEGSVVDNKHSPSVINDIHWEQQSLSLL